MPSFSLTRSRTRSRTAWRAGALSAPRDMGTFNPPAARPAAIVITNHLEVFILPSHTQQSLEKLQPKTTGPEKFRTIAEHLAQFRPATHRSEERRVGKECRSRWS